MRWCVAKVLTNQTDPVPPELGDLKIPPFGGEGREGKERILAVEILLPPLNHKQVIAAITHGNAWMTGNQSSL